VPREAPTDEELLRAFLGGDERAFEVLFDRYRDRIFGYLRRLVADHALAEEIFQEVFLQLFRRASRFDASRSFRSWFFSLAHNRAMDLLRGSGGKKERGLTAGTENLPAEEPQPSPEDLVVGIEAARSLERMLQRLSGEHRAVLLLRFREGLTYEEIAEVVGCPLGTAKSRVHHALRRLREMMGRES